MGQDRGKPAAGKSGGGKAINHPEDVAVAGGGAVLRYGGLCLKEELA